MTVGYERRLALDWAGEVLRELSALPMDDEARWQVTVAKLREEARHILRHYPEPWQIEAATTSHMPLHEWISRRT